MSSLLDEIRKISKEAAREIKSAGFETDSDIRSLNRQDLFELLPGKDKLRMRKEIHRVICQLPQLSPQHEAVYKDLKNFFLSSRLADKLTDNETLLEYLHKMKVFTEALIHLLETNWANLPEKPNAIVYKANSARQASASDGNATDSTSSTFSLLSPSTWISFTSSPLVTATPSLKTASSSTMPSAIQRYTNTTVMYNMVVSGKTLDKHVDVMERLNGQFPGRSVCLLLKEAQRDQDSQVTLVFCPVVSRAGTDVDAALQDIPSDKPVIVVAMHHMHTPTAQPAPRTNPRVQLGVNIFFHETKGLLNCPQNDDAINEIKAKLLEISTKKSYMNPQ